MKWQANIPVNIDTEILNKYKQMKFSNAQK